MSNRGKEEFGTVSQLGSGSTEYKDTYNPDVLEHFVNKHPKTIQMITFNCPEVTSLCPKTKQPDFATIYINYIPNEKMVESKSLKLYLFSFRNHGSFHEDCVSIILEDLVKLLDPLYIEVIGKFLPRGGISIDPFSQYYENSDEADKLVDFNISSFAYERLVNRNNPVEEVNNR